MKAVKIIIPIAIAVAVLLIGIIVVVIIIGNKGGKKMELGELKSFSYSPGYGDMNGASHHERLSKDDAGEWIIESSDRDSFEEPMTITLYAVSEDAVKEFESFIKDKNVLSLMNRKDSDEFITDYSSWSYIFDFDNTSIGGSKWDYYTISQYKQYSKADYELLKKLDQQFEALHGDIISQEIEKEE